MKISWSTVYLFIYHQLPQDEKFSLSRTLSLLSFRLQSKQWSSIGILSLLWWMTWVECTSPTFLFTFGKLSKSIVNLSLLSKGISYYNFLLWFKTTRLRIWNPYINLIVMFWRYFLYGWTFHGETLKPLHLILSFFSLVYVVLMCPTFQDFSSCTKKCLEGWQWLEI